MGTHYFYDPSMGVTAKSKNTVGKRACHVTLLGEFQANPESRPVLLVLPP